MTWCWRLLLSGEPELAGARIRGGGIRRPDPTCDSACGSEFIGSAGHQQSGERLIGSVYRDELMDLFGETGDFAAVVFDDSASERDGVIVVSVVEAESEFLEVPHDLELEGAGLVFGRFASAIEPDEGFFLIEAFLTEIDECAIDIGGMGFLLEGFESGDGGGEGIVEVGVMLNNSRAEQDGHHLVVVEFVIGDSTKLDEGKFLDVRFIINGERNGLGEPTAIAEGIDIDGMLRFAEGFEGIDGGSELDLQRGISGSFVGGLASECIEGGGRPGVADELFPFPASELALFARWSLGGEPPAPVEVLIIDGEGFLGFDFEFFSDFGAGGFAESIDDFIDLIDFLHGQDGDGEVFLAGSFADDGQLAADVRDGIEGDGDGGERPIEDVVESGKGFAGIILGKRRDGDASEVGFAVEDRQQFGDGVDLEFSAGDLKASGGESDFEELGDGFEFDGAVKISFEFGSATKRNDGGFFVSGPGAAETGIDPERGFFGIFFRELTEFFGGSAEAGAGGELLRLGGSFYGSGDFKELIRRTDGIGDVATFVDVVEFFCEFIFLGRIERSIVCPLEVSAEGHNATGVAVDIGDGGGERHGRFGGNLGGDGEGEIDFRLCGGEAFCLHGEEGVEHEAEGVFRCDGEERFDCFLGFRSPAGSEEEVGLDGEYPEIAGKFGFDFIERGEGLLESALVDQIDDLDHLFGGIVAAEFEFFSASTGAEGVDIELGAGHVSRFSRDGRK